MAKQTINLGNTVNDGTGDALRVGAQKINANFTELYNLLGGNNIQVVSSINAGLGLVASSSSGEVTITAQQASADTVGVVKIGNGITVSEDGTISSPLYTLPRAATNILGGIKVGNNLTIDNEGVLSAATQTYTLPTASISTLGGVKIGNGLEMVNGVLNVTTSEIAAALQSGAVTVQLVDDGDVTGRLKATGPLIVLAGGQDSNDNYLQLQWTRDRDNPDLVKSNYLWLDTNGISLSTTNPVETEFLPFYTNTLFYNTQGTLTFNDLGQVGPVQSPGGIDLYASEGMDWTQLNYGNRNYVWINSDGAYIDISTEPTAVPSRWQFNIDSSTVIPGSIVFPDGSTQTTAYQGESPAEITIDRLTNGVNEITLDSTGALNIVNRIYSASNMVLDSITETNITAGTDLRFFSDGVFTLRNYSNENGVSISTGFTTPNQKSWLFNTNGSTTLPTATVPTTAKGAVGDQQGMFIVDDDYIYYCKETYTNGVADIWNRTAQTSWSN